MIKQQNFKDLDYYKSNYNTFQSRAIKLYTNDKHSVINNHFRTKGNPFRYKKVSDIKLTYNDQFMFFCKELDKITKSNNLLEDTILYRGLRPNHHIEKAIKTKSFCERGFCSTTFDKDIAIEKATVKNENGEIIDFGWIMEIYAPKNTFGGVIMEHSVKPDEIEFLLPRNIIFNIFDCDKEKNILRVLTKNFNNMSINKLC